MNSSTCRVDLEFLPETGALLKKTEINRLTMWWFRYVYLYIYWIDVDGLTD